MSPTRRQRGEGPVVTLTEFLLDRIAEDEALVRDGWDSDGRARVATMWTGGEPGYTTVASDGGGEWIADGRELSDARDIRVLFDPARVLAECEAKRLRLKIADDLEAEADDDTYRWAHSVAEQIRKVEALPYADHSDYREAWRP